MPIRPEARHLYPPPREWRAIRSEILFRAQKRCECTGQCGDVHDACGSQLSAPRCNAPNGEIILRASEHPARWWLHGACSLCLGGDPECRPVKVILTIAHLDHDPTHNDPANLKALCQRCHLRLDVDEARKALEAHNLKARGVEGSKASG